MPPCGFCVVRLCVCALCVLLVCNVWCLRVCWRVCWCWCWCGTLTHHPLHTIPLPHLSSCVRSKRSNVCTFRTSPVCTGTTPASYHMRAWCRYTRRGFECTHGVFSEPHHTARTHRDHNDIHNTTRKQHTTSHGDRDRERQTRTETDRERQR